MVDNGQSVAKDGVPRIRDRGLRKGDIIRVVLCGGEEAFILVGDIRADADSVSVYFLYPIGNFSPDDTRCGLKGMVLSGQLRGGGQAVSGRGMDVVDAMARFLPSDIPARGITVIGRFDDADIWESLREAQSGADDIPTAFLPSRRRMREAADRFIARMIARPPEPQSY
jgi:hypothetical protein